MSLKPEKSSRSLDTEGDSHSQSGKGEVSLTPYLPSTTTPTQTERNGPYLVRKAHSTEAVDDAYNYAGDVAIAYTKEEEKSVRKKCDRIVLPLLAIVYFSQFLDKSLLNYASVTGLPISGTHYNQVSAAFYYGFLACVYIQTYLSRKFNPTLYLGFNIILWSIVLACHAAAPRFAPFFALRFLLGAFESVVAPTLITTIAAFYPKREQASRIATFYMCNGLTQMVGPLIAFGTTFYDGAGLGGTNSAWKLLYIVFGVAAFVVGVVVILFLPASPAQARFLNEREKRVVYERIRDNSSGTVARGWKIDQVKEAFSDPKLYIVWIFTLSFSIPNGALGSFSALIIKQFGYTSRQTLLLSIPGGFVGTLFTIGTSLLSDRTSERILPAIICIVPTVIGMAILVSLGQNASGHRPVAIFATIITQTFGSALSIVYAWLATNMGGTSKKQVATYTNMLCFALGNIIGSYVFTAPTAPAYVPGKTAVMICLIIGIALCVSLRFYTAWEQRKKDRQLAILRQEKKWTDEDVSREKDAAAFKDMTDRENVHFRYMS